MSRKETAQDPEGEEAQRARRDALEKTGASLPAPRGAALRRWNYDTSLAHGVNRATNSTV